MLDFSLCSCYIDLCLRNGPEKYDAPSAIFVFIFIVHGLYQP